MIKKIKERKIWILVIVSFIMVFSIMIYGFVETYKAEKATELEDTSTDSEEEVVSSNTSEDSLLMKMQDNLTEDYGIAPDNYVWNLDGTLLSLGDKSLSAEEVVYSYFNGLSSLDFSSVQKFSRDSLVVDTYSGYFDVNNKNTDYADSFERNVYRECLLSMQVEGIVNTTVFAENKQVFTVRVSMLDLTVKDFWVSDKAEIYSNLRVYNSDQSDPTKADMYLYDYISSYYSSGSADRREVLFDITLQKYPDLNTGWLVSIDTDVDSACRYADGSLVINYIKEKYADEGVDYLAKLEEGNSSKSTDTSNSSSKEK